MMDEAARPQMYPSLVITMRKTFLKACFHTKSKVNRTKIKAKRFFLRIWIMGSETPCEMDPRLDQKFCALCNLSLVACSCTINAEYSFDACLMLAKWRQSSHIRPGLGLHHVALYIFSQFYLRYHTYTIPPWTKWLPLRRQHFQVHFLEWKC